MTSLRVSRTHFPVTALGYGRRMGLWVQGCRLACVGCVAQDTWDPGDGTDVTIAALLDEVALAMRAGAVGLTVSGGEPLQQAPALAHLFRGVHALRGSCGLDFDLMLYTGYEPEELDRWQRGAADLADVVVTGRYRVTEPTGLIWRGSSNQRLRLQTELGRTRYESYLDFAPAEPPIQVEADADGAWLIGVPTPGTLPAIERTLTEQGLDIEAVSWRRVRNRSTPRQPPKLTAVDRFEPPQP